MKVSIIIPSHNEENVIESVIKNISKILKKEEIIVVSNGCTDNTPKIIDGLKLKNVKHVEIKERIGKGGAIIEGFKRADGDIVGFLDADDAFRSEDILKIINETKHTNCVIASKWKGKKISQVDWPIRRKLFSRGWNLLIKSFLNLNFSDTQAGLKFFQRRVLNSIDLDFICKGFEFDVELLYKIKKKGFSIKEIGVSIKSKNTSSFNLSYAPKMFFNLIILWLRSR